MPKQVARELRMGLLSANHAECHPLADKLLLTTNLYIVIVIIESPKTTAAPNFCR